MQFTLKFGLHTVVLFLGIVSFSWKEWYQLGNWVIPNCLLLLPGQALTSPLIHRWLIV